MKTLKYPMDLFYLDEGVSSASGSIAGHEYVDLGLSVKWATCNVGANSPEDYGNYYAWGETSPKSSYTEWNSKTYGKEMGDIGGNVSYDAARANWGSTWRLPTSDEISELVETCDWKWTTMNGKNGYKVTSKANGKSIFLPAAGGRGHSSLDFEGFLSNYWSDDMVLANDDELDFEGTLGNYWSSTPVTLIAYDAYALGFSSDVVDWCGYGRFGGQCVRPVSE